MRRCSDLHLHCRAATFVRCESPHFAAQHSPASSATSRPSSADPSSVVPVQAVAGSTDPLLNISLEDLMNVEVTSVSRHAQSVADARQP